MITDDYVLAKYVRERYPYIEKSMDYIMYLANISPSELLILINKYKGDLDHVASSGVGGNDGGQSVC